MCLLVDRIYARSESVAGCQALVNLRVIIIHLLYSLSYNRSVAPSKASTSQSEISRYLFQYPVFLLFLKVISWPSTSPSSSPLSNLFSRHVLRKMWPIQLAFLLFIVCMILHSTLCLCNKPSFFTRLVQLIFSILLQYLRTSRLFLIYSPNCQSFSTIQSYAPYVALPWFRP